MLIYVDVPRYEPHAYKNLICTVRDMTVKYIWRGENKEITVPAGFLSDGATIPRAFWPLIGSPFSPQFAAASITHDYCCIHKYDVEEMSCLFEWILIDSYVDRNLAGLMKIAVHAYKSVV